MVPSPTSRAQGTPTQTVRAPLSILRTETVLSRFPIHTLAKHGRVTIRIRRTTVQGDLDVRWDVSYNEHYGPPRQLAYKLDTIVINQLLDTVPRPVPRLLRVGSLRYIGSLLGVQDSGMQQTHLKQALHQNASAYIVASLRYQGRDGTTHRLDAGFTRYSVLFTGERLPDGTLADAVYLVLSEPYREVLTHAPVRPLDYAYLKALTPIAQRFYELLSYKMFAALKHRLRSATLRYGDYCLLATQHRYGDAVQMQKQMYKVHRPHLQSGYLTRLQYVATTDAEGQPDWLLQYMPGPKARAEYAAFMRQPGAEAAAALLAPDEADPEELATTVARALPETTRPPQTPRTPVTVAGKRATTARTGPTRTMTADTTTLASSSDLVQAQAHALVAAFYQRFYGVTMATPQPKELAQAAQLLAQHGAATAHYLVDFSARVAPETQYRPQVFGGILHYLSRALAAYATQATPVATAQAEADEARRWEERYMQWRQETLAQLRDALSPDALAALEAEHRARLVAEGTPAWALDLAVRVAVDAVLEARAELPPVDAWRQQQEAGG